MLNINYCKCQKVYI